MDYAELGEGAMAAVFVPCSLLWALHFSFGPPMALLCTAWPTLLRLSVSLFLVGRVEQ